jgi:hypothetical protein
MNQAYVEVWSGATLNELKAQLENHHFCYFLRWPHDVSGIIDHAELERKDLSQTPEGQAFNYAAELRWKRNGDRFDLLWLGTQTPASDFQELPGEWVYEDHQAVVYKKTETRLPKAVKLPHIHIGQRYFRDRQTAIIHFIALRIYNDVCS